MKKSLFFLFVICACQQIFADSFVVTKSVPYRDGSAECLLDIYHPENTDAKVPVVVWYHGGGLTVGHREIPQELRDKGLCIVGVEYRLSSKDSGIKTSDCVDDAAASAAWVKKNIAKYGGDTTRVYLAGHSAGGYLVMMIGLDKTRLAKYGVDADSFAALIPFSGQAITHFETRRQRGISDLQPIIDVDAPLYYVRGDCPPILLICGQRERELLGRYEENAYLWRMFQLAGHKAAYLYELDGFDHGTMSHPAHSILLEYIRNQK